MKKYRKYQKYLPVVLLVPVMQVILMGFLIYFQTNTGSFLMMLILQIIAALLMDVVLVYLFGRIISRFEIEDRISEMYQARQREWDYGAMIQEHMDSMQQLCGSLEKQIAQMKKSLSVANGATEQGSVKSDAGSAEAILKRMEEELEAQRVERYCDNEVVNALLTACKKHCDDSQITMQAYCHLGKDMGVDEIDLCSIMGNLLKTAVSTAEHDSRFCQMTVKADTRAGKLIMRVEIESAEVNLTSQTVATTKTYSKGAFRKKLWSRELDVVKRLCEKHNGYMEVEEIENGVAYIAVI